MTWETIDGRGRGRRRASLMAKTVASPQLTIIGYLVLMPSRFNLRTADAELGLIYVFAWPRIGHGQNWFRGREASPSGINKIIFSHAGTVPSRASTVLASSVVRPCVSYTCAARSIAVVRSRSPRSAQEITIRVAQRSTNHPPRRRRLTADRGTTSPQFIVHLCDMARELCSP